MKRRDEAQRFAFSSLQRNPGTGYGKTVKHPRGTDRLRAFLAQVSWPVLILEFLGTTVIWSAAVAVPYYVWVGDTVGHGERGYVEWVVQVLLATLSFPTSATMMESIPASVAPLTVLTAAGGLIFPSLFIGAIVIKLFVSPDLLVFREKLSLANWAKSNNAPAVVSPHLAVRCYSGTKFKLLDVEFSAVLRFKKTDENGTVLLRHAHLAISNPRFPLVPPKLPYTIMIPLDSGDLSPDHSDLLSLQGHSVNEHSLLFVVVSGTIPELGSDFTEAHDFCLADAFTTSPYASVDFDEETARWTGWERFDE